MGGGMLPGNRDILYFLPCSNGNRTPVRQRPAARSVSSGAACPARLSFAAAGPNIHAPAFLWSAIDHASRDPVRIRARRRPHGSARHRRRGCGEDAARPVRCRLGAQPAREPLLRDLSRRSALRRSGARPVARSDRRVERGGPPDARRRRSDSGGEPDTGGPAQPRALPSHVCRCDRRPRVGNPVPPAQSHGRHTEPRPGHAAPAVRDGEGLRELARAPGQVQQPHGPEHRADARRHCEEDGPAARDHGARAAADRQRSWSTIRQRARTTLLSRPCPTRSRLPSRHGCAPPRRRRSAQVSCRRTGASTSSSARSTCRPAATRSVSAISRAARRGISDASAGSRPPT